MIFDILSTIAQIAHDAKIEAFIVMIDAIPGVHVQ